MNLDKAIEIKETPEPGYFAIPIRDRRVANNLSIEALKEVIEARETIPAWRWEPLPGET